MSSELYLRKVEQSDADILLQWANDVQVRENAFNTERITLEEHIRWFDKMMNDNNEVQYIFMHDELPIGQIRLTLNGEHAEVHYSISSSYRGRGYGHKIIEQIIKTIKEEFSQVKTIRGKVKPSTLQSSCCFSDCGFEEKYRLFEYSID